MEPTNQGEVPKLSQVIQIDEGKIQEHLGEVVSSTTEETLNAMLDAEADILPLLAALSPNADPSTIVKPLSQLKKLLETDDGDASDFLLEARSVFSQVLTSAEIDSLSAHIGNFAYTDALRSVSEIASRLSLRLE